MTELKQVDEKDIISRKTICEVVLHGSAPSQCFAECELLSSERSECIVIKIKGTDAEIKIKKTAFLNIMGFGYDYKKFCERI